MKDGDDTQDMTLALVDDPGKLVSALAALASKDRGGIVLTVGRLAQAGIAGKFLSQFGREVQQLIKEGKIKQDYLDDPQNHGNLVKVLKLIDSEVTDVERFQAIKSAFLWTITPSTDEVDEVSAEKRHQILDIVARLTSGEVLLLRALWDIHEGNSSKAIRKTANSASAQAWQQAVAEYMGHGLAELVETHEKGLMEKHLITPRTNSDGSGVIANNRARISDLGVSVCEAIITFRTEQGEITGP